MTKTAELERNTAAVTGSPYVPISVATLVPSAFENIDLYQRSADKINYRLFRGKDLPLTEKDLRHLSERGIRLLYITTGDQETYQDYLCENLTELLDNEDVPPTERFEMLNQVTQDSLREAFAGEDTDQAVSASLDLGKHTVDFLDRADVLAHDVFSVLKHDFHTFIHSANVCSYCVLLAKELGISTRDELDAISTGALLHDIGKVGIPWSILTKPGLLTDEERTQIQDHPQNGFTQLSRREDLSWEQLMIVYQHHERLDGRGYPVGADGENIHPWARLCAVVDIFDAMTSDRPYYKARPVSEVLSYLSKQAGSGLEVEMVKCWKSMMSKAVR